jgi:hypothetical protein
MNATPELSARIRALNFEYMEIEAKIPRCQTVEEYDALCARQREIEYEIEILVARREIARWTQSAEKTAK